MNNHFERPRWIQSVRESRARLPSDSGDLNPVHAKEAEGGCGVIGIAASEPIRGHHLLRSLRQMRNRGNGKGGGVAIAGLDPTQFGVSTLAMRDQFLLTVAYLDGRARARVEREFIEPGMEIHHAHEFPVFPLPDLETPPPAVVSYFVSVKTASLHELGEGLREATDDREMLEEEWVYQNSYRLNREFYASLGEQQAFVLSHGKDMIALKMVGYGDDVVETYGLGDLLGHVWIGHHRYPTKGKVWHPGGAHPFVGMHEALVHNGDFANYASVRDYLAQQNIHPLFLTDTEVSVLVFDLLHRTYGYPLEYVIEALAPTTERDFTMLPGKKQEIYRMLQEIHIHGSPDGPWFFLIAQSAAGESAGPRTARLIGITDTSMLRPQVFALQRGTGDGPSVAFAASEKQAIDAALVSLSGEKDEYWTRPDMFWVARGGSYTDGGAFIFSVEREADGEGRLKCTDKFGVEIDIPDPAPPYRVNVVDHHRQSPVDLSVERDPSEVASDFIRAVPRFEYEEVLGLTDELLRLSDEDQGRHLALNVLTQLIDRRYATGRLRRSSVLSLLDSALASLFEKSLEDPTPAYVGWAAGMPLPESRVGQTLILDGRGFAPEGTDSLARALVAAVEGGFRQVLLTNARGHRFLANGLGAGQSGLRVDVYGSPGDYLASGIDGAEVIVHGSGQDQLAQIMRSGTLVIHGDVGQTFLYAAKGGECYVLGNAAGRPLINAVGSPRVVINGTCLDYLAESFMAGDPLNGGGFAVVNALEFDDRGQWIDLPEPYPGSNLFSLASGGAIFVRDPQRKLGVDQLNGGAFAPFTSDHWELIRPLLERNERHFGIPVSRLLEVDGAPAAPQEIYRSILPVREQALQPEEVWVGEHA